MFHHGRWLSTLIPCNCLRMSSCKNEHKCPYHKTALQFGTPISISLKIYCPLLRSCHAIIKGSMSILLYNLGVSFKGKMCPSQVMPVVVHFQHITQVFSALLSTFGPFFLKQQITLILHKSHAALLHVQSGFTQSRATFTFCPCRSHNDT